ncbi:probable LRR receptor-like serine/threonine-protein kinase At3g47570 [Durio zibethinus]|uniref:Probable LRR receptor-like serine/threonine-protein kinase At3g47570 n=1 Tax=Durio zibethinus TaxID=66656 RepID=A0A6P5Z5Y3_DURZI|nr:probable LRR receptor-like serine/threonine-protein kinase At3g47570 [Durio zibethinus]
MRTFYFELVHVWIRLYALSFTSRTKSVRKLDLARTKSVDHSLFQYPMPLTSSRFRLTGTNLVSSLRKLEKLRRLNTGENLLGSQGAKDLNFICSLTSATSLEIVLINDNSFGGILPECISNLSTAMTLFYMEGNNTVGRIPAGFGNLINLEGLAVGENQLSVSIPSVIGRLQKLKYFAVSINSISGSIPTSLGNLKMLIKLYLNDNNLQGEIPPSLGKCENLIFLDLSNNNLSGSIPSQIGGLSSLKFKKDVAQNMLSGAIPNDLGNCMRLEVLLMRGYFFNGSIPSSLSSLKGLTNLDLSRNNLTGKIPEFLVTFGSLHCLNLSFNNFEGLVPVGGVFKNISAMFFEGNSKLCGGTPEFHLPTCDNLKQHKGRSTTSLKSIIAIVSALSGVILVFSVIFLFWFRKKIKQPASSTAENPLLKLSYQSILKATNGFSSANLIGTGNFGFVYKGILEENGVGILFTCE